jgi:hypothetical protein
MRRLSPPQAFLFATHFFLMLFIVTSANAQQEKEINKQYQTWLVLNGTVRFTDKWGAVASFQVNNYHFITDPNFYFVSLGANRWLQNNFSAALLYSHKWDATVTGSGTIYANENRITEQLKYTSSIGKAGMQQRFRIEERWQQKIESGEKTDQYKYSTRLRYLLGADIPLFKNPTLPELSVSDEILLQFGKDIVYNTFDQNRLFIGIKQKLSDTWCYELGYLMQYEQNSSGYQYTLDNDFRIFLYYAPDLRKTKTGPHHAHIESVE